MTFREGAHQARTGTGPAVAAVLRNTAIGYHPIFGETNIARATRRANRRPNDVIEVVTSNNRLRNDPGLRAVSRLPSTPGRAEQACPTVTRSFQWGAAPCHRGAGPRTPEGGSTAHGVSIQACD